MVDEKIIKFFEGVLSKTKEGKIPWEPTAQESNFIAAVGGQFTLSVSEWTEPIPGSTPSMRATGQGSQRYALVLRDMRSIITTVTDRDEGIRPGAMRELYETARWQAVHGGEKINKAIEVVNSL